MSQIAIIRFFRFSFITEDSYEGKITNPLSLNLYTYCENDPLGNVDPSGHSKKSTKSKKSNTKSNSNTTTNTNTKTSTNNNTNTKTDKKSNDSLKNRTITNVLTGSVDKVAEGLINAKVQMTKVVAKGGEPFGPGFKIQGEATTIAGTMAKSAVGKALVSKVGLVSAAMLVPTVYTDASENQGAEALGKVGLDIAAVGATVGIAAVVTAGVVMAAPALGVGTIGAGVAFTIGVATGLAVDIGKDQLEDAIWDDNN